MKKTLALLLAMVMMVALVACGGSSSSSGSASGSSSSSSSDSGSSAPEEAPKIEILMTSFDNAATVACQLGQRFADSVAEKSDGRITINFQTDGTLANETEQYDLIRNNEIQICYFADSFGSQIASGYDPGVIPFLFTSAEDADAVFDSTLGDKIKETIKETGNVYLLGPSRRTPRLLTASKAITTPEELHGLKLRVPEIQEWVTVWNAMGATCTVVAWPECYSALQTGVVDGQENPIDNIYANKIYEVNNYIMMTEHMYGLNKWVVNCDFWDGLSADDQALLTECFQEAKDWANGSLQEISDGYFEELTAGGINVVEVDKALFQAAATPGIDEVVSAMQPEAQEYVAAYLAGEL